MQRFTFICGPDDYLVQRAGREAFERLAAGIEDDLSREVVSGFANTVAEVETAVARFREAVQTLGLFGGRKVVWFRDVSFLADTPTGRAEGTLAQVELLQGTLASIPPEEVAVLVTAAPVDRRRSFYKWCEKEADFTFTGSLDGEAGRAALGGVALAEARLLGAKLEPAALDLLLERAGGNPRILVNEVRKLAAHAEEGGAITEAAVTELTPNFAEGDFFEAAEAFFRADLPWTLEAIHRHFFAGGDARPLLASLQNRGRLLLQLKALQEGGALGAGAVTKGSMDRAGALYGAKFGEAASEKSAYNVLTQHPFYLGKLAEGLRGRTLRQLIDWQLEFVRAFDEVNRSGEAQEEVLRALAIRCLAPREAA